MQPPPSILEPPPTPPAPAPVLPYETPQTLDPAVRRRWLIVGLLFVASAINYLDRQTLSVLGPTLRTQLHLSDADYSNAVSAFLLSYAVMYSLAGRWIDRVGARVGMVACVAWWSLATMLTSLARGAMSLAAFRFLLGIGEPGVFPAGMKACGELFSARNRALPIGVFSSGISVGAVLAPPIIAWITIAFGWRAAFLIPGAIGLIWIPLWLLTFRRPPASTAAEIAAVQQRRRPWKSVLAQPKVWGLILARFASDPVWYFYLFWLPDYLQRERGMSLMQIGLFAWIPYVFADIGNVCGGAMTDWLIRRRGFAPARARLVALGCVGLLAPFGALVGYAHTSAQVIVVACLIACLCQVWSTNTATLAADVSDADERATVMGMMGTAGSLGGIAFSQALAIVIGMKGYSAAFVLAATLHPIGLICLYFLLRAHLRGAREARSMENLT